MNPLARVRSPAQPGGDQLTKTFVENCKNALSLPNCSSSLFVWVDDWVVGETRERCSVGNRMHIFDLLEAFDQAPAWDRLLAAADALLAGKHNNTWNRIVWLFNEQRPKRHPGMRLHSRADQIYATWIAHFQGPT